MINIHFSFKTKPGMKLEFMQTIGSIMIDLHKVEGCINIDLQQDDQEKNQFYLRLDWQTRKYIKTLLRSKEYDILEGALKVLCQDPIVEICDVENRTIKVEEYDLKGVNFYERIRYEFMDD
jgi:quinol monooxygenase YgiN